jgi:hypothetical protein
MASSVERHYGARGVHGLAVHPGGIWTPLQKHIPAEVMEVYKKNEEINKFVKSTEQGAATTVLAAIGKEYDGRGGLYLEDCGEWGPVKGASIRCWMGGMRGMRLMRRGRRGCEGLAWGWWGWRVMWSAKGGRIGCYGDWEAAEAAKLMEEMERGNRTVLRTWVAGGFDRFNNAC